MTGEESLSEGVSDQVRLWEIMSIIGGKIHPCGGHHSLSLGPRLYKEEKMS